MLLKAFEVKHYSNNKFLTEGLKNQKSKMLGTFQPLFSVAKRFNGVCILFTFRSPYNKES